MAYEKMKHYIRFSEFKVEASGFWFGVTCLCYFIVGGLIVSELAQQISAAF